LADQIFHVAVHELERRGGKLHVKLGKDELEVTKTKERVIAQLFDLYKRRATKSYGKFSTGPDAVPTQQSLRAYLAKRGEGFPDLIAGLMTTLQVEAAKLNAASEGFVFFAHLDRDDRQFLLVAIVSNKLGASLTRDFDVADAEHLDIDGFRFAGRIDLTEWAANGDRYISFLKGKGEVSNYFKTFLGADTTSQDREDTRQLAEALKAFADAKDLGGKARDTFLSRAKAFCDQVALAKQPLSFEALSNAVFPDEPEPLKDFLVDPDRKLNEGFVPHRGALGTLTKLERKTKFWTVAFEREAIHEGKVAYDPDQNILILKDLPDDFAAEVLRETRDG